MKICVISVVDKVTDTVHTPGVLPVFITEGDSNIWLEVNE